MKINQLVISLLTIGFIVFFPYAGLLPFFSYSIPVLLITWLTLKYSGENFADLGFSFKRFNPKALWIGTLATLIILPFMQLIFFPALERIITLDSNDIELYDTIRGGELQLILMILMGWLIGGIYEEIVFHGFIFTRLERMFGGKYATTISFVITSIIFGLYHWLLGPLGVVNAWIVGSAYLALFLYFKRNLWYSIISHGTYNTLVMLLIYQGYL